MTNQFISSASRCEDVNLSIRVSPGSADAERATHTTSQRSLFLTWMQQVSCAGFLLGFIPNSALHAAQIVASPEGTATTYVSQEGPLVFAPRAARAQKVIFDTPEKQLIYAPDTPFRRFFDSHAYDFDSAGLEYAKTTILGDIVNRLRSREYIRDLVGQVIDDYREEAIPGTTFAEQARYLLKPLTGATEGSKNTNVLQLVLKRFTNQLSQIQEAHLKELLGQSTISTQNIERFVSSLEDTQARSPEKDANRQKWQRQRAALLSDTYYLRLLQANYPDMEDEEIDRFINDRNFEDDLWNTITFGLDHNNRAALRAMKAELSQRLKQRDWLRQVVEAAISKRDDLFRKAGSPTAGLTEAQNIFKKFADNNLISTTLVQAARSDALPLWRAFLAHANAPVTNAASRFLLQTPGADDRNLDAGELRRFGDKLRAALLQSDPVTGQRRNPEQTKQLLVEALSKPEWAAQFCPEFGASKSLEQLRAYWPGALTNHPMLKRPHEEYAKALADKNTNDTAKAAMQWVGALALCVSNANAVRAADDRVDIGAYQWQVAAQATNVLSQTIVSEGKPKSQMDLVLASLDKIPVPLSSARAQRRFIDDFQTVFQGWHDLLASDDPIVTSVLKSDNLRFATAALRRKAASQIPKLYFDKDIPEAGALTARFKQAVENPEVAYLFGDGPSNPRAIEAFSREFYSAFHDPQKLNEAIKAEREADYDYWWLTFYPKAIPQGVKKLAGESIIEVAFPETVVPEAQYHRWLQDSKLNGAGVKAAAGGGQNARKGARPARSQKPEDVPGGQPGNIELRNAAALLRDTLTVLEAGELKSRFEEVRPVMLHALDAFTEPRKTEEEQFWNGIRALYDAVFPEDGAWVDELETLVKTSLVPEGEIFRSRLYGTNDFNLQKLRHQKTEMDFDEMLLSIANWKPPVRCPKESELTNGVCGIRALIANRWHDSRTTNITAQFTTNISALVTTNFATNTTYRTKIRDRVHAFALNYRLRGKTDPQVLNELRGDLKNLDFDPMHVLFSVLAVTETKARLPEKLNLFAWAGAQGLMIFSGPQSAWTDTNSLLHAHAVDYFNTAEPRRGDSVTAVTNIDETCYVAMQAEGDIYSLMLNAYFSRYPDVPTKKSIRDAYFDNGKERLRALFYDWLDHYGILYDHPFSPALIRRLGQESFLTPKSQRLLFQAVTNELHIFTEQQRAALEAWVQEARVNREFAEETRDEARKQYADAHAEFELAQKQLNEAEEKVLQSFLWGAESLGRRQSAGEHITNSLALLKVAQAPPASLFELPVPAHSHLVRASNSMSDAISNLFRATQNRDTANTELARAEEQLKEGTDLFGWGTAQLNVAMARYAMATNQFRLATNQFSVAGTQRILATNLLQLADSQTNLAEKQLSLAGGQLDLSSNQFGLATNQTNTVAWQLQLAIDQSNIASNHSLAASSQFHLASNFFFTALRDHSNAVQRYESLNKQLMTVTNVLQYGGLKGTNYRHALSAVVNTIFGQFEYYPLVAELDEKLFDDYFISVWATAKLVGETERHLVPYKAIQKDDFRSFRSWARPFYQRGIQIVEMLPSSRDDLVSMSINEGGVVARVAGQADAAAAYDMNKLKMAQRYGSIASSSLQKMVRERDLTNGIDVAAEKFGEGSSSRSRQVFRDLAEVDKSGTSQGYTLGATASGSAYGRARAALAYSKRREYLDAAITAAGRGDNFAKWLVRKSDLRSDLAQKGGKKLVAAAHNGFPNGDQPFHMLVKIPRAAVREDWNGRNYIFFNSTYIATKKVSAWRVAGFPGLIMKLPFAAMNPHWWNEIEEGLGGTQFPFMWDVRQEIEQTTLLKEPNFLGGEIWLDDTDKIKHSEILEMLAAEDAFVRITREAQSGDLSRVMTDIQKESQQFGPETRKEIRARVKELDDQVRSELNAESVTNRIATLEKQVAEMKAKLKEPAGTNGTPGATP